jgi:VIT1/CCC1 family predicted Fe2+/Mn2+ transporter
MADQMPQSEQAAQTAAPQPTQPAVQSAPATGRRPAFQDLKIQLTDEELANPGVQKCVLDMLNRAEEQCNDLKQIETNFHKTDKRADVLEEKLKSNKINEIMFGVGVGLGGGIIGLTPYFWDQKPETGVFVLAVGLLLIIGATIGRISFK